RGDDSSALHNAAALRSGVGANRVSMLARAFGTIGPCAAYAAESGPAAMLVELGRSLRGVVVDERSADRYRTHLSRLLGLRSPREMDGDALPPQYRQRYPVLVTA